MPIYAFAVNSVSRGYHEYKAVWVSPTVGEVLSCEREAGNNHDTYAVAFKKVIDGSYVVVGHVPRIISPICSVFIQKGGTIEGTVNGSPQYSFDLPQGGQDVPCVLKFSTSHSDELDKFKKRIEVTLGIKVEAELLQPSVVKEEAVIEPVVMPEEKVKDEMLALSADVPIALIDLTNRDGSPARKRQKVCGVERIIMGEELTDETINQAQQLLKSKYPQFNGFQSTLLQQRKMAPTDREIRNKVQIIHCSRRKHWIIATTVNCKEGEVRIYDSVFNSCDDEVELVVRNLFQADTAKGSPHIKMMHCQKQVGGKDCGVFSIAFATAIVLGLNPGKVTFLQPVMRAHLVNCLNKGEIIMFPYK